MVFRKAVLKYRILIIRAKISYEAFVKKMTIPELLLNQITKTHQLFNESHFEYPPVLIQKFSLLMSGDLSSVFTRLIEFELEHQRFLLHRGGSCEKQSKAYAETMKTLNAIK